MEITRSGAAAGPRRVVELVALAALLAACGGSSGGSPAGGTTAPKGIFLGTGHFTGTQTINGATSSFNTSPYVLGFVTSTGDYLLLSYRTGSPAIVTNVDSGSGAVSGGSFSASDNLNAWMYPWGTPIYVAQGGALTSTFARNADGSGRSITGSITYAGTQGATLTLPLGYVGGDVAPATLAAIARSYTGAFYANINTSGYGNLPALSSTLTISPTGALSGTVTCLTISFGSQPPCTVTGTVTPRADLNAYDVSMSFVNGSSSNSFVTGFTGKTATGLAYYEATTGSLMFAALAPDGTTFAFSN